MMTMHKINDLNGFIERLKSPVEKCVLHDDAVKAADLIEIWKGVADALYGAILEHAGGEGIDAYHWGLGETAKLGFISTIEQ